MKNSVLEKVYEANDIDIPDVMVESEIDNMIAEFDQQLRAQGMDIQTYFQYIGKDAAEFRNEIREDAYKKTKTRMIVTAVAEQEKFEASDEDVDAEIANMAQAYGLEADKIKEMLGAQNIAMIAATSRSERPLTSCMTMP